MMTPVDLAGLAESVEKRRSRSGRLRLSVDLCGVPYLQYRIRPHTEGWSGIALGIVCEPSAQEGVAGVEVVSPAGRIVAQSVRPLSKVVPVAPVRFCFDPLHGSASGTFVVRVFVRNARPGVRVVERGLLPAVVARLAGSRGRRLVCDLAYASPPEACGEASSLLPPRDTGADAPKPAAPAGSADTSEYQRQRTLVEQTWSKAPAVKSLWQSKVYYQTSMRMLTGGTAPHFMNYVKQRYLPDRKAPRALSVGSGLGDLERQGYEAGLYESCLGLEVSPGAIEIARDYASKLGFPLEYQQADLNLVTLRGRTGPFALIFANASLHHVANLERLLAEIDAVLAPGGLFFFNEYVGPSRFQWRPKTLEICNRILQVMPSRLRGGLQTIQRMRYQAFMNGDPSEAVHSEEILSLATMFFELAEVRNGGTTITHPLLNDIIRHFDEDDEDQEAMLRLIFLLEEILIEEGVLESDAKLAIFRKRA